MPRLTTDCATNYCNRTLVVEVIVGNVVTFFLGRGVHHCNWLVEKVLNGTSAPFGLFSATTW